MSIMIYPVIMQEGEEWRCLYSLNGEYQLSCAGCTVHVIPVQFSHSCFKIIDSAHKTCSLKTKGALHNKPNESRS